MYGGIGINAHVIVNRSLVLRHLAIGILPFTDPTVDMYKAFVQSLNTQVKEVKD